MLHIIPLNDSDVLFMEETGNIIVPREKLPPRIHQNDSVRIYFKEDTENVYHEYNVVEDDNLNDIVTLEWISFKDNQILTRLKTQLILIWQQKLNVQRRLLRK